jgi:hypothetical protein
VTNAYHVNTRAIYATISQPWGKLSIGRLEEQFPTSQNGLKTLGYTYGTTYIYTNPFDFKEVADGISYTYQADNGFGVNVYYAKHTTNDGTNTATLDKDIDYDRYGVEPFYKWDGGGATLNVEYARNMLSVSTEKNYAVYVNPAIMQTWGNFTIRFEGKIGWGETKTRVGDVRSEVDSEGLGLYVQATYKYGDGDVNLMGWFADGSSIDDRNEKNGKTKRHDLVGMGDFAPFLVAYYENTLSGRVGRLGGGSPYGAAADRGRLGAANRANHWGVGLLGNHNFTPAVRFNWGIGMFRLVEQTYLNQSKDLGVEVDLGVRIQVIKGVTFETQLGYLFNGQAWRNGDGTEASPYRDSKDTYAWLNALHFSF